MDRNHGATFRDSGLDSGRIHRSLHEVGGHDIQSADRIRMELCTADLRVASVARRVPTWKCFRRPSGTSPGSHDRRAIAHPEAYRDPPTRPRRRLLRGPSQHRLSRSPDARPPLGIPSPSHLPALVRPFPGWPNRDPLGEFGAVNLYSFVLNSPTTEVDLHGMVPLTPVLSFLKDCLVDVLKDKALQPIEEMVTGAQACGALLRELEDSAADLTRPCNFCSGVEIKADFKPLLENDGLARRTAKCILNKLTKGAAKKIGPTLTDAERDLLEKALEGKLEDFADVFVVDVHNKVVGKCERGKMTFDIRLGTTLGLGESRFELGGGSLLQGVCGTTFGALHKQCEDCD